MAWGLRAYCGLALSLVLLLLRTSSASAAEVKPAPLPAARFALPRSGQVSAFDQAGTPIDFQASGQDGDLQRGAVWPDPRFSVNRDGTVSDALTGLMWFKVGNCFGAQPWPTAQQSVADFNQGKITCRDLPASAFHDWFLPDVNQLASLIDAQAAVPAEALRLAGLVDVENGLYWSSTVYVGHMNAWAVDLASGTMAPQSKLEPHFVLLARLETAGKNTVPTMAPPAAAPSAEGKAAPSPARLVDNGDGSLTDTGTGLMWLAASPCLTAKADWQGALAAVQRLNIGACSVGATTYTDWALPNAVELRSLIDYQRDYPALPPGPLTKLLGQEGWTATTVVASPAQAFAVDFDSGALLGIDKSETHRVLAVRSLLPPGERPRRAMEGHRSLTVEERFVLGRDPELGPEVSWPPSPRFLSNGDGTSMDALTGTVWLADGSCLGRQSWKDSFEILKKFTFRPSDYKCKDYEAGSVEWEIPTLAELGELVNKEAKDGAAWLNKEGLSEVQGSGIYWTATETPLNLYFADAITLKTGKAGNYPKSLKFYLLPKRKAAPLVTKREPLLQLTANNLDQAVELGPDEPLSLVVLLHTFGLRMPADFWFWYETPDHKQLWLTPLRTWTETPTPVYQGPLFNIKGYEIFRSLAHNGLAPGSYTFHFAVDTSPNGRLDTPHYESLLTVQIEE